MLSEFDPNQQFEKMTEELVMYVYTRDNITCQICGKSGSELHHIEMKSKGGKNCANNLILLCSMCHRGDKSVHSHSLKVDLKEKIKNNEKKLRENLI